MDVEDVARKLEPLAPAEVAHLLRVRQTGDAQLRLLVERKLYQEAYKRLGDFNKKVLLSLPPEKNSKGAFHVGKVLYEQEKWDFGLASNEINRNIAIFGMSGSGKTNVAFILLEQLVAKRIPFLFLDWKRTARHMIPRLRRRVQIFTAGRSISPFAFNPFVPPPGIETHNYVNLLVDTLASAYTLGDGAKSVLQNAIQQCLQNGKSSTSVADVLAAVKNLKAAGRAQGWQISTIRALQSLDSSKTTMTSPTTQEKLIRTLCHSPTIIELDGLDQNAKKFIVPMLCLWVYYLHLQEPGRERLKQVIFVEEAHHVFYRQEQRAKETAMDMLMRQCREIGIGVIVIDQHPHLVSSAALGNTYATFCLNQKDPSDINKTAALSLVKDVEKKYFSMLPVGQAIVKLQDRWRRPFVVRFPLVEVNKGSVTDERLAKYLMGGAGSGSIGSENGKSGQVRRVLNAVKVFDNASLRFLHDVLEYPRDGVKVRYSRLGLSSYAGNAIKERLVGQGWLDSEIVPSGNSRKVILRPSEKTRELLRLGHGRDFGRESLAHEHWKHHYAEHFRKKGYKVAVEASRPRGGGRVDVYAWKDGATVGIEIETGKSDVVGNVRKDLLSGFDRVIVVATDIQAQGRIAKMLANARLYPSTRLQITSQDSQRFNTLQS